MSVLGQKAGVAMGLNQSTRGHEHKQIELENSIRKLSKRAFLR